MQRSLTLIALSTVLAAASLSAWGCGGGDDNGSVASADGGADGSGDDGTVGALDGGVDTALPPLPGMSNVQGVLDDDSVAVTFDPVDGAKDYRIYPLPADQDISVDGDGFVMVKNALYRCAGDRESPAAILDDQAQVQSGAVKTLVDNQEVGGFTRTLADATLGYVYTTPGPGRVPVYALGDSDKDADNSCYFQRWGASRVKTYTSSEAERSSLLASRFRDDGVVFYVPDAASGSTRAIYTDDDGGTHYYFPEGAEADAHAGKKAAFVVLKDPAAETQPLMRVFYQNGCGSSHDELVAGKERFERARRQGDQLPWFGVEWSGVSAPTTLVVEALDQGCPFQGHLSPKSVPSTSGHQAFVTLDDVRAKSSTGEVFVNGQHDPTSRPKAIARAFIAVKPRPHEPMDFLATFGPQSTPEVFTDTDCGALDNNCFQSWRVQSPTWDVSFDSVETDVWALGQVQGELWVTYADWASDTNGKLRMTARQKANMDAATFLHATMEVDVTTTGRRYPQILISDRDAPVQRHLEEGKTLVVQTFGDWPSVYQIEICDHRTWDVNNQCPEYDLYHLPSGQLAANEEIGEVAAASHRVLFDVYASTQRMYLFLAGKPYACADLPAASVPSGAVTVSFGDVLYHSGVDNVFAFHEQHLKTETRRHFDNLGFSSGVPAPAWDEARFPCAPAIAP